MINNYGQLLVTVSVVLALVFNASISGQQSSPGDEKSEHPRVGNINGTVVNENGQPIANATVLVRSFSSPPQRRITSTDKQGKFNVSDLDRTAYTLTASAPAYTAPLQDPDSNQSTVYRIGDVARLELIKGGVITGIVTAPTGEPVTGISVHAHQIRDINNRPSRFGLPARERSTDDRGIYRIYGLPPGTYIVSAGGGLYNYANAYDTDVPTFAPSSTRDTAGEIIVRVGEETNNVDIRYRGEQGHVVSGSVSGADAGTPADYFVLLTSLFGGQSFPSDYANQSAGSQGFAFYGVADGDYYLTAQMFAMAGQERVSEHRRIKVRGADITGIELFTKPLGAVSGKVVFEGSTAPECKGKRRPVFAETLISPWHKEDNVGKDRPRFWWTLGAPTYADKEGAFTIRNLMPGQYQFNVKIFAKYWYVQALSLSSSGNASKSGKMGLTVDAARNWTTVKSGQRISGLNITLASGATSFQGQFRLPEGKQQPARLFVHLIPAERERADDVMRFFASRVGEHGTFNFNHVPPGRYRVLGRIEPADELSILSRLRLPDEFDFRARLRQEAEAAKTEIELKPCQNVTGFQLPFEP